MLPFVVASLSHNLQKVSDITQIQFLLSNPMVYHMINSK